MDHQQAAGNFAAKFTIRNWRGRDWPISFISDGAKGRFEARVKQAAMATARKAYEDGLLNKREYLEQRDFILEDIQKGAYLFWEPKCMDVMAAADGSGVEFLLLCLMQDEHPNLTDADVKKLLEEKGGEVHDILLLLKDELWAWIAQKQAEAKKAGAAIPAPPQSISATSTPA